MGWHPAPEETMADLYQSAYSGAGSFARGDFRYEHLGENRYREHKIVNTDRAVPTGREVRVSGHEIVYLN